MEDGVIVLSHASPLSATLIQQPYNLLYGHADGTHNASKQVDAFLRGFSQRSTHGVLLRFFIVLESRLVEGLLLLFGELFVDLRELVFGFLELLLILFGAHLFAVLHEVRNPLIGLFDPCLCLLVDKAFNNGVAEMPLDGLSEVFGSVARLLQKALILGKKPIERDARKAGKGLVFHLFLIFKHFLSRRNSVLCTRIEHTQKSSVRPCEHC